jgi:hypothetical protein
MPDLRVVPHLLKHVLHVGKSKPVLARPFSLVDALLPSVSSARRICLRKKWIGHALGCLA